VDAALELARFASRAAQHVGDRVDMARLARVTGAHQRDLGLRIAEALDPAGGDEGHRLQWLQRAARRDPEMRITRGEQEQTVTVDDHHRPIVSAVDCVAAGDDRERSMGTTG
jgi:hypothetical protein